MLLIVILVIHANSWPILSIIAHLLHDAGHSGREDDADFETNVCERLWKICAAAIVVQGGNN